MYMLLMSNLSEQFFFASFSPTTHYPHSCFLKLCLSRFYLLRTQFTHFPVLVTFRKDDAVAAVQADMANVAGVLSFSDGGRLIQTTSG